jgi:hypothetical protein
MSRVELACRFIWRWRKLRAARIRLLVSRWSERGLLPKLRRASAGGNPHTVCAVQRLIHLNGPFTRRQVNAGP